MPKLDLPEEDLARLSSKVEADYVLMRRVKSLLQSLVMIVSPLAESIKN